MHFNENMKRSIFLLFILLSCVVMNSCSQSSGDSLYTDVSQNGLYFRILSDDTYMVEGIDTGTIDNLVIPSTINGKSVTIIAKYGFQNWDIKTLSIPNTITMIGDYAFQNCKLLSSVEIPSSVVTISTHAFNDCSKLNYVKFNNGLKTIGKGAFYNAGNIEEIIIPNTVEIIKEYGLYTQINKVYVPKNVIKIEKSAFLSKGWNGSNNIYCEVPEKPSTWNEVFAADYYGKAFLDSVFWGVQNK